MLQLRKSPSALLTTQLQALPVVRPPRSTLLNLVASTSGRSALLADSSACNGKPSIARGGQQRLLVRGRAPSACPSLPQAAVSATSGTTDIFASINPSIVLVVAFVGLMVLALKKVFDTPSRTYDNNVGQEYDAWTEEGVLEYYWGEHIHLGYYTDQEIKAGYLKKNFKQAKYDFVDKMLEFSGAQSPKKILDVGCGFGGTSRHLAKKFRDSEITGITLSPKQVARGTQLAQEQGVPHAKFQVMDALAMTFPDNTFDLVWACESGEHMPDKKKYVEEMTRVLKPGGTLVIACWCQREEGDKPFTQDDKDRLTFLYEEWAHPYFISIEEFGRHMEGTGKLESITLADWNRNTIDSWRHSIWVGVFDPWIVIFKGPRIWYKTLREIVTLERMHQAFDMGLMQYGMMTGRKALPTASADKAAGAQAAADLVGASSA